MTWYRGAQLRKRIQKWKYGFGEMRTPGVCKSDIGTLLLLNVQFAKSANFRFFKQVSAALFK